MAIAWYLCPYRRRPATDHPARYCAMDDYTPDIVADGGAWAESEVLGNHAIVKVRASVSTLATIAADTDFTRLPVAQLDDQLSSLTTGVKAAIKNKVLALGYAEDEITARFGSDLGAYTLGDLLRFVAKRRLKPRYDAKADAIICDGAEQSVRTIDSVDRAVS